MADCENLISLSLPVSFTILTCNLVLSYKFHGNLKTDRYFFLKKLDNPKINHQFTSPPSFKDIENKEGN